MGDKDNRLTRAQFFRSGGRKAFEGLLRAVNEGAALLGQQTQEPAGAAAHGLLRPPGALPEARFLETCERCGHCVDACPPLALFPAPAHYGAIVGTPVLRPSRMACLLCEGTPCAAACPSGALRPIPVADIRLGVARIDRDRCLPWNGTPCHQCSRVCPEHIAAIRIDRKQKPHVEEDPCTGCGQCELHCPTSPKAIIVEPTARGTVRTRG